VQFHLDPRGRLGFAEADSNRVLAISECHLPEAPINQLWPQLEFEPGSGVQRVSLRVGQESEMLLSLESDSAELPELELEAGISVVHVFDDNAVPLAGAEHVAMQVLERVFRVSAASFFQVNTPMAELMVRHLLDQLPPAASTLLDVYCGVGLFSAFLAPRCTRVIGVESSASACADFEANLDEFEHIELYEAAAEHALPALKVQLQPDIVLVDPPRAGVEKRALEAIVEMHPDTLAYVSCDPATLARDAARLMRGGYELVQATPFDLFPQTWHIESISLFKGK
jgi:23S rRNA (uracil1939-C5)-methyltransferase